MGQFDADTILWDLLNRSLAGGESFFSVAQPRVGDSYIVTACGAPDVHGNFDEAIASAQQYLADRQDQDLEIRVRGLSSSPQARISNRKPSYTIVPTGLVDGLHLVTSSYRVSPDVIDEYHRLVKQSEGFRDEPYRQSIRLLSNLQDEFRKELERIQETFPEHPYAAVHFADPTVVYLADAKQKFGVLNDDLKRRGLPELLLWLSTQDDMENTFS